VYLLCLQCAGSGVFIAPITHIADGVEWAKIRFFYMCTRPCIVPVQCTPDRLSLTRAGYRSNWSEAPDRA
jgi:hypothetical protein